MTAGITIVGLGPGDPDLVTRGAWQALEQAEQVYLRTAKHPGVSELPIGGQSHSFDALYESGRPIAEIYDEIAERILAGGRDTAGVVYAVPGSPTIGEATVGRIREGAASAGVPLRILEGVSLVEVALSALGIDGLDGLSIVDALELAERYHPSFPPESHILVAQLHSRLVASNVKLTLMNQYPDDHPVVLLRAAGTEKAWHRRYPLHEIDTEPAFDMLTTLYVPPLAQGSAFESFQETVAHLRAPDGCPWDREQTHRSLRPHLLEETYEALEAIDREEYGSLAEELGDLMLQLVIQVQIATEEGTFQMADVLRGINSKLVRRHPHVFGDVPVEDVGEVLLNWETLKADERGPDGDGTALSGVPKTLPALAQASEYQSRAARLGFDWPAIDGVLAKVREELAEVEHAAEGRPQADELGDLLFAVVNLARWLAVDAEAALRAANARFRERFEWMERSLEGGARQMKDMNIEELDSLWDQAKGELG